MSSGTLYIVATPIGNLSDITLRALEILQNVSTIAAEDTRHSRILLQHYAITTPTVSLHEHNEAQLSSRLLHSLQQGNDIALISDAGTPLISDPGYRLVMLAQRAHITVSPIPGPCAAIAALSVSGLASDQFYFVGFLPARKQARISQLQQFKHNPATLICYEAPHRIIATLQDMQTIFGHERRLVLAKELTKHFETLRVGNTNDLLDWLLADKNHRRGEFVILVAGFKHSEEGELSRDEQHLLRCLAAELPQAQAAKLAAKITRRHKSELYHWLEQLKGV